ncbi:MAG: T9SS type A sorting domain-containing protein [Bacteroidia bacterium]|nr:T9SS type A sorting domain-containing protein [Bacteroidia bacterium]MDW8157569.1 T9SS type A sorting domain-containing protein [Bacteroidia bacterium]
MIIWICNLLFLLAIARNLYAQNNSWVEDSIVIDKSSAQQVWYSLQNGVVKTSPQDDWDIAFQVYLATAGIWVNEAKGLALYRAGIDTTQWMVLDTAGKINENNRLYNSDTSWTYGAFNAERDPNNLFDDGWGIYEPTTRIVKGRKMFFLKNVDGSIKKIWVRYLDSYANKFYFRIANLDNSQMQEVVCDRSRFSNQLFAYFSLATSQFLPPREPPIRSWDLLFTHYYKASFPRTKVAGVLSNVVLNRQRNFVPVGVIIAREKPVDVEKVTLPPSSKYKTAINTIGDDWKRFTPQPPPGKWIIEDSLAYFIKDYNGIIWKIVFTNFSDSPQTKYFFKKQRITPASISNSLGSRNNNLVVYPTPVHEGSPQYAILNTDLFYPFSVIITNLQGKVVWQASFSKSINTSPIVLPSLPCGSYIITLNAESYQVSQKFAVIP